MAPISMRTLVAAVLFPASSALVVHTNIDGSDDLAANVTEDFGGDQKLKLKKLTTGHHCLGDWNAINPSFAPIPSTTNMAVAFRGLCLHKKEGHAIWYSRMVVGVVPGNAIRANNRQNMEFKSYQFAPDLRFHDNHDTMVECAMAALDKAIGPEDPRLVKTPSGLYAIVTGYDLVHKNGQKYPECGKHGMLLYAAKVKSLSPPEFGAPVKLTFPGMGMVEKNWAMFVPPLAKGAHVRAIYSIHPHRIASVNLQTGNVNFVAETHSEVVKKLAEMHGVSPEDFHGGAGVAHVQRTGGREYFLSMMHFAKELPGGVKEYWNFPYKFSTTTPYEILHIGNKLPLVLNRNPAYGEMVAFITTVLYDQGDVFIGYGSGDSSSRTFRMPLATFNDKFFPSSLLSTGDFVIEEGRNLTEA